MGQGGPFLFLVVIGSLVMVAWFWLYDWPRWRYTRGPILWQRTVHLPRTADAFDIQHAFAATQEGWLFDPLETHEFEPGLIAFREQGWSFRFLTYSPMMVGLVRIDAIRREARIEGRLEWLTASIAVFVSAMGIQLAGPQALFVIAAMGLGLAAIYATQATRFAALADRIQSGPKE